MSPRRRALTRIELLAEALTEAKDIQDQLRRVDLRKTQGPLRDALKAARDAQDEAVTHLEIAILVEEPPPIGSGALLTG